MKIDYNIDPLGDTDPGERLQNSILYAALSTAMGETLQPFCSLHAHDGRAPLWGPDRHGLRADRIAMAVAAYENPAVLDALEARIVPRENVQTEMDRLSASGLGATLRNMRDPVNRLRHLEPGSGFDLQGSNASHIGADKYPHDILVHPHSGGAFERRFLVAGGEIAGETPVHYDEDPLAVMDRSPWTMMSRTSLSGLSSLEAGDPELLRQQRTAAMELLCDFDMPSGAIDVCGSLTKTGEWRAQIVAVTAAPPGAFSIFYADPERYGEAVADALPLIEPGLGETLEP